MTRFGSWVAGLAGARKDLLDEVPEAQSRFKALGGLLIATALVASASAAFALSAALNLPAALAILFGIGWGVLILTIDRALIQSMGSDHGVIRNVGMILPRLLIAVVLGIVVSTPLVLRVFDKEITNQMQLMKQSAIDGFNKEQSTNSLYAQIPGLEKQVADLQKQVDAPPGVNAASDPRVKSAQTALDTAQAARDLAKQKVSSPGAIDPAADPQVVDAQKAYDAAVANYNKLENAAQCELAGGTICGDTSGTGVPGVGAAYQNAQARADEAKTQRDQALTALQSAQAAAGTRLQTAAAAGHGTAQQDLKDSEAAVVAATDKLATVTKQVTTELSDAATKTLAANQTQLTQLNTRTAGLKSEQEAARQEFNARLANSDGILAKLEALSQLGDQNPAMLWADRILALMFIFIEILPVLTKAMMNIGGKFAYDEILEARDKSIVHAATLRSELMKSNAEKESEFMARRYEHFIGQQSLSAELVNTEVTKVQREVIQEALAIWRGKAMQVADSQLKEYSAKPAVPPAGPYVGTEWVNTTYESGAFAQPSAPGPTGEQTLALYPVPQR